MAKSTKGGVKGDKAPAESNISRESFKKDAKAIDLGEILKGRLANPKEFSTGSFGWHNNEKVTVNVGGLAVRVQLNLILTVIGSKGI